MHSVETALANGAGVVCVKLLQKESRTRGEEGGVTGLGVCWRRLFCIPNPYLEERCLTPEQCQIITNADELSLACLGGRCDLLSADFSAQFVFTPPAAGHSGPSRLKMIVCNRQELAVKERTLK